MTGQNDAGRRIGASGLDLDCVDKLLSTTRAVRRRLDLTRPVPLGVIMECIELAIQAPTGSNGQGWRWIVVTDPDQLAALAELYRPASPPDGSLPPDPPRTVPPDDPAQQRMLASAEYLMAHMHEVPAMVVPCTANAGGAAGWAPSIYPAVWSLMLALRSRGLGSCLTTVHLFREAEAAALLSVPNGFVQTCLLPVAFFTGDDFQPAKRRPATEVTFLDRWGESVTREDG